jgi:hypothetical protein
MQQHHLVSVCGSGTCPTVFTTEGDDLVIQGYIPDAQTAASAPPGEARVIIPRALLGEAARRLLEQPTC